MNYINEKKNYLFIFLGNNTNQEFKRGQLGVNVIRLHDNMPPVFRRSSEYNSNYSPSMKAVLTEEIWRDESGALTILNDVVLVINCQ